VNYGIIISPNRLSRSFLSGAIRSLFSDDRLPFFAGEIRFTRIFKEATGGSCVRFNEENPRRFAVR